MDKAFDMNVVGNPTIVNAETIVGGSVKASTNRYRCPVCSEYVTFVEVRSRNNYFRHTNQNEFTIVCENRVQSSQTAFNYNEVKGSPLYLYKLANDNYKLLIGFPSLGKYYSSMLNGKDVSMTIRGTKTRKILIDEVNFNVEDPTLFELDFLPHNNKYSIKYYSSNNRIIELLNSKWSNFSDFDYSSGVIFHYSENGGKKLGVGSVIYSETQYFYLGINSPPYIFGLELKEVCSITLDNKILKLYIIKYYENMESIKSFSQDFCKERLRLIYRTKKPVIVPLWPPTYSIASESTVINNSKKIVYYYKDANRREVIRKNDTSDEDVEICYISNEQALFEINTTNNNTYVSLDSKYGDQEIIINNRDRSPKGFNVLCDIKSQSGENSDNTIRTDLEYCLETNTNIDLVFVSNKARIMKISNSPKSIKRSLTIAEAGVLVVKCNNFTLNKYTSMDSDRHINRDEISDSKLYKIIKNTPKSKYVYFGTINQYLSGLACYPLSYKIINQMRDGNKIPDNIRKILLKYGGKNAKSNL